MTRQYKQAIGRVNMISLDDVCQLISTELVQDELGQFVEVESPYMVFCSKLSITRAEYHSSGSLGHKPEIMLIVDADTYQNEIKLEYDNKKYSIYKTFQRVDGFMELYCEVEKT